MKRLVFTRDQRERSDGYMRFLSPLRERISSRAAIASIAGLLFLGGVAVFFGGAAPAFGGSAGHPQHGSAGHSAAAPASPWPGGVWQPGPAQYGVGQELNDSFRMPDGTVLAGDVKYPTDPATGQRAAGRFPVIVTMNPYFNMGISTETSLPSYIVERGYIGVQVDVRGTGRSYGNYGMFSPQSERDFVEVAEFLARHYPDANGTAALAGQSYLGTDVLAAGQYIEPGSPIKALFAASAGADWYREMAVPSEIPSTFSIGYGALDQFRDGGYAPGYSSDAVTGGPLTYDGSFWQSRAPINSAQEIAGIHMPTLMVSGEADFNAAMSLEMYTAIQNASVGRSIWAPMAPNQRADGNYQLIWSTESDVGAPGYNYTPYELEWFDTFLKGQRTGVADTSTPLHLYEWEADQFVDAADYPFTRSYTRYYLNGSSTSQAPYAMNNGGLSTTPPASTTGADAIKWAPPASAPTPSNASNILDYTSEPFSNGALLAGPINARLYVSSTARNSMIVATLIDVAPDGTTTSVYHIWEPDGVLLGTARSIDPRKSWYDSTGAPILAYHPFTIGTQEPVTPGQTVAMDVTLTPRMWAVLPGHRLRLQITTQAPTLLAPTQPQIHSLTGATFSIGRNSQNSSYLNLPVLPLNTFTPDTAYAQPGPAGSAPLDQPLNYTDEPQNPAGTPGSAVTPPQYNIPPHGQ
jgi:uncharacterized protein